MWHQKTADKRMPDTDNKRSYKSLLIRYGTIFQGLQELKNQRYSPLRWKPQADHQKKSQKATRKRQVLQNQYFVGLFLLPFGYLDRHEKGGSRKNPLSPFSGAVLQINIFGSVWNFGDLVQYTAISLKNDSFPCRNEPNLQLSISKPAKNSLTDSLCYNPVSAVSVLFANALLEGDSGWRQKKTPPARIGCSQGGVLSEPV